MLFKFQSESVSHSVVSDSFWPHDNSSPGSFVYRFSSVHLLSHVQLFATPWTAAHQASLSITNSLSLLTLMSVESVMPSSHLILCRPLLLLPLIFPSIRVFSNESTLRMRWPKYWSFSFSIRLSSEHWGNRQIWPWNTEWSRTKASRVLPRERTGHSKHPLPTTQEKTLHMDITRWYRGKINAKTP